MEPRSAIGDDARTGRWTLHVGCQGVFGMRGGLAKDVLNPTPDKVRVLTGNVGGSFGMKSPVYPEYGPLLLAARDARPAGQVDRRALRKLPDRPSWPRHQRVAELALDKDGRFLARAARPAPAMPAPTSIAPMPATAQRGARTCIDVYRTPVMEVSSQGGVHQHHADRRLSRRRPAGGQLLHGAADRHRGARDGHRPVELRRRNHIAPEPMPYKTPSGMNYDSRRVHHGPRQGAGGRRLARLRQAQGESAARGKLRGRGIGCYLEVTGAAEPRRWAASASRTTAPSPCVTGTLDYGQGHATPFAQVLSGQARHSVRALPAAAGRQRPAQGRAAAPAARSRRWSPARRSSRPATC